MGSISIPDPGELTQQQPSFDEFQRQTSLMTSCTLLWKELSDHFTSLEQTLLKKSDEIKQKIKTLDTETKASLVSLEERETTMEISVAIALQKVESAVAAATATAGTSNNSSHDDGGEVDDSDGLLLRLKSFCVKMDSLGFWGFVISRKKEMESMRFQIPLALAECADPPRFVLDSISDVFPVDKRKLCMNDLSWACVLLLESLIPVMVDPISENSSFLVTPSVKKTAKAIADKWKEESFDPANNVKPRDDVHTFFQHLITFGIVKNDDLCLYRKLVIGSAWRKQMPKLALSLGLAHQMPDMIEELISKGQQVDAVHFTYEAGLADRFSPVCLLKSFLKDAKKAVTSILEDSNNTSRAAHLAARKEQSALKAVIKCIEEYNLEAEFPPENLKKRAEQLEKVKTEKKRRPAAAGPANKRTRGSNVGHMPPAKAGRITNAYVSSFPTPPSFVRSPSHPQYPATGIPSYPIYGHGGSGRSPPPYAAYSPESAAPLSPPLSYPATPPMNYASAYSGYVPTVYQQAYYL